MLWAIIEEVVGIGLRGVTVTAGSTGGERIEGSSLVWCEARKELREGHGNTAWVVHLEQLLLLFREVRGTTKKFSTPSSIYPSNSAILLNQFTTKILITRLTNQSKITSIQTFVDQRRKNLIRSPIYTPIPFPVMINRDRQVFRVTRPKPWLLRHLT